MVGLVLDNDGDNVNTLSKSPYGGRSTERIRPASAGQRGMREQLVFSELSWKAYFNSHRIKR